MVSIILNWLGREGLKLMKILNNEGTEEYKTSMGLFKVPSKILIPQHNKTILS